MKKIFVSSLFLAGSLFAASNEEILDLYKDFPKEIKIEITDRIPIEKTGFDAIVISMSKGEQKHQEILFTKDDFIMTDLVNLKTKTSYKQSIEEQLKIKSLSAIYPKEASENIIKIGNDSKKPTLVIFTDADCPFCRKEMSKIEERAKVANIEIVMTSVHGDEGHAKSAKIYEECKNAKTDADKIAILRKYYAENQGVPTDVKPEDVKKAKDLATKYQSAGVTGVPFLIEKSKIVK